MPKKRPPKRKSSRQRSSRAKNKRRILQFRPEDELDIFHSVVNHIGEELIVADREARIVFANKAAVRGLGHSRKEILSRKFTDFLEDKISVKEWYKVYFAPVRKKKKPISFTINRVIKGGKVRTVYMTVVYMFHQSRHYIVAVGRDITEQKAFEGKLKESEDKYRLLSEQAAEGIMVLDKKGHTIYANKAAGKMFKTDASTLIGSHFEKHVEASIKDEAWKFFHKVMNGDPVIQQEFRLKDSKGGFVPIEFTASPIFRNKKISQIHVVFRDISEKKEIESLKRETEKIETFQNFIAGTTQEIQQPLKGLLDHSQNLIEKYEDRSYEYIGYKEFKDIIRTLKSMNDQVKYCFDTTDRLNRLNRRKANLEKGHCSVNHVIRESIKMLKHPLEVSDIHLKLSLSPRLPLVAINSLDLSQALANIITNAIQSLPGGGGKVEIKTTHLRSKHQIRIDCQDDGVGIPKDLLTKIFDPFFTTKTRGLEKNSGLGLYIVYSLIKSHQGDVIVKSDFRRGTLVTILLPVYRSKKSAKKK